MDTGWAQLPALFIELESESPTEPMLSGLSPLRQSVATVTAVYAASCRWRSSRITTEANSRIFSSNG